MDSKSDYETARSDYDKAWWRYVEAPGGREKARRELTKAREALYRAISIASTPRNAGTNH